MKFDFAVRKILDESPAENFGQVCDKALKWALDRATQGASLHSATSPNALCLFKHRTVMFDGKFGKRERERNNLAGTDMDRGAQTEKFGYRVRSSRKGLLPIESISVSICF